MRLKEFVMFDKGNIFESVMSIERMHYEKAMRLYGEYIVLSVMNFDDDKITSIILQEMMH